MGKLATIKACETVRVKLATSMPSPITDRQVIAPTSITFQWSWNAYANKDTFKGNPNIEVVFPKDVNWGGYYYQAISAYAPHPAAARLWEEFLYSDEGQLGWIKGYCAPARLADMTARNVIPAELTAKLPDAALPRALGSAT